MLERGNINYSLVFLLEMSTDLLDSASRDVITNEFQIYSISTSLEGTEKLIFLCFTPFHPYFSPFFGGIGGGFCVIVGG